MPQENARKRARKLVSLPNGDTCYVPVITEIDFIDLVGDPSALAVKWAVGQEFDYTVDNTAQGGRKVHVDQVNPIIVDADGVPTTDPPSANSSQSLYVERIDTWPIVSPVERGQEFDFTPDNKTGAGPTDSSGNRVLPHFSTHEKTHIYRYYKDPMNPDDSGVWIDSELIDQWGFIDGVNRGQELEFTLNNQTNAQFQGGDLSGQADPSDPDITIGDGSGEGTQDNPVRLDPFQNIVNFSGNLPVFILSLTGSSAWASTGLPSDTGVPTRDPMTNEPNPPPDGPMPTINDDQAFNNTWATGWTASTTSSGAQVGFGFGPGPPVSGNGGGGFGEFQYVGTGVNAGFINLASTSGTGAAIATFGTVAGPPLVVNGKPIPGFVATLTIAMGVFGFPFDAGPIMGDRGFGPGSFQPTLNWWLYTMGYYTAGNEVQASSFTITVSGSPFVFNNGNWQAVGLKAGVFIGGNLQVYCVPV